MSYIEQIRWNFSFTQSATSTASSAQLPRGVSWRQIECLEWAQRGKTSAEIATIR